MSDIESIKEKQGLVKVPGVERDSKYRRVAKFLFLIGSKQAALVLQKLDDIQVEKVIAELVTIRSVDKDEALAILDEFSALYEQHKSSMGGLGVAKDILQQAYGDTKAEEILARSVPEIPVKPFAYLKDMATDELALVLQDELPSACAIVVSYLPPKQAAKYLSSISDEGKKKDIVVHLAKMQKLNADIVQALSDALRKKIVAFSLQKTSKLDGKSVLAHILRNSSIQTEKHILDRLSEEDAELAQDILQQMYSFDDILLMSDKDVQHVLTHFSDTDIRFLLFNRSQEIRRKIIVNISRNKAMFILDDEKNMEAPRPAEALEVEKRFVETMIQEEQVGRIIIPKDEGEQFV